MITLSLDEYGAFEGINNKSKPVYIAGLLFDDKDIDSEKNTERKRISAYYDAVIKDAADMSSCPSEFSYPSSLHSDGDKIRDYEVVRLVKEQIRKSLPEFFRKGTYHGKQLTYVNSIGRRSILDSRSGKYYLFVILRSQTGMSRMLKANASILVKDDYASNLYFHMADEIVSRLLFHNPIIRDVRSVAIDIATRSSGHLYVTDKLYEEYRNLGYKRIEREDGKYSFNLTNPDVYRTIIADEITDTGNTGMVIDPFKVSSISYKSETKNQEFLYLADSICSFFSFNLLGKNADEWILEITQRVYDLTGSEDNFVFGYDEIDLHYQKTWKSYEEGDYYTALSLIYDAKQKKGSFVDHYNKYWFTRIESLIIESNNQVNLFLAIQKLYGSIISNEMDQDKSVFILSAIEKLADSLKDTMRIPEKRKYLYRLYDSGVSIYCHIGDSVKAEEYFEKCTSLANTVGLEEYLNTRNRMSVFCCDNFELSRARIISEEDVTYHEMLSEMKEEVKIAGFREEGTASLGKSYSQLAQVMAFERDPKAEQTFRKALNCFDPLSANYKITQSYLLHYYLDQYKTEQFVDAHRDEAKTYFCGEDSLTKQLKYIISEGTQEDPLINLKYALYVYVRSLYRYRLSDVNENILLKLRTIEETVQKKRKDNRPVLTGHPSELIFIYLSLIERAVGSRTIAQQYEERIDTCVKYKGATIEVICQFGHIECANADEDYNTRDRMSYDLCKFILKSYPIFAKEESIMLVNPYEWLKKTITFMYC